MFAAKLHVNSAYLFVYRSYIALKSSILDPALRNWPSGQRTISRATDFVRRRFFPSREIWVQVQAGLAQGLWLHLRIPDEAGFWRGEHEPGIQRQIAAVAHPGDVVYDVGAHLGSLALGAARLVGGSPGGRVVAFEADPANVERLQLHAARNQLRQILQPVHAAVWSRAAADQIDFRRGRSTFSQGGVEADGQRPAVPGSDLIRVPVITLDQFIAAGNPPPQLIKVDVEGGEYQVLQGAAECFSKFRPLLIVEVHHQQACDSIDAWLAQARYSVDWTIPPEKFPRYVMAWPAERTKPFPG